MKYIETNMVRVRDSCQELIAFRTTIRKQENKILSQRDFLREASFRIFSPLPDSGDYNANMILCLLDSSHGPV